MASKVNVQPRKIDKHQKHLHAKNITADPSTQELILNLSEAEQGLLEKITAWITSVWKM